MTHASAARANLSCWAVERYQGQSPYLHLYSLYELPTGSVTRPLIKERDSCPTVVPGVVLERETNAREYEQRSVGSEGLDDSPSTCKRPRGGSNRIFLAWL